MEIMKLGKKLLSLLTVLCLTLSLFPTMALAAEDEESTGSPATSVSVGSTTLSVGNYLTSNGTVTTTEPNEGTGYIHFSSDGTLELNNYNDESSGTTHQISGNSGEDLIIKLNGDNHITSSGNGIRSYGKLTISGPGSLRLTSATNGTTIHATDTITIQGGAKVTAPGGYSGQSIHMQNSGSSAKIIITGSGTEVTATTGSSSGKVFCDGSGIIEVNDGAKLTASTISGTVKVNGTVQNNPGSSVNAPSATSGYTVSGTVKNGDTPIAGASVQLSCSTDTADTSTVIPTSTTVENGTYTFSNIPDGTYTITASKTGYNETSVPTQVKVSGSDVTAQNITLTPINYNIRVEGTQVTGANMNNVLGNSGTPTVTYNPTTKTLTLNNATISSENTQGQGIYASDDLTINLIGTNEITGSGNSIYSTKPLTITSSENGSLTMSSKNNMRTLYATADITISGSAVVNATINGGAQAIHSNPTGGNGSITITGNAKVTAKNTRTLSSQTSASKEDAHSVALLTGSYPENASSTITGTITVSESASLLAQGSTQALMCGTLTHTGLTAKASTNYTGANLVDCSDSNHASYKYVHIYPVSDTVKYDVWVGDTQITSANKDSIQNGVTYDPDTKTLTLNNATITGAPNRQYTSNIKDACGIYAKHDLKIALVGNNKINETPQAQRDGSYGIFVSGRLTFTSDSAGSLTVSGGTSINSGNAWVPGVYASGITVKNCNVTAIGGTATSDSYPVAYAMSKAPTLVGAEVTETNTTNRADGATKDNYSASSISRYKYLKIEKTTEEDTTVAAPVIVPEGGYITSDPTVTITCPTSDAEIHYTIDGSEPTASSTKYANAFSITFSDTTPITVKAIAVKTVNGQQQQSAPVEAKFSKREPGNEVTKVALSVDVNTHTTNLKVGDRETLRAAVKHEETPIDGLTVTWTSDNEEVATVEKGGITAKSVGKARITAAVVENGVTYSDFCDVIVEARPASSHQSSSSTTYYDVYAAVSGEGGSVAAGTKRASRGTTVTVTATAASGYQVAQVSAVDKDGKTVSLTDKGDGVYTFVMPASKVDVTARFAQVQKPEEKDPYGDVSKDSYYYDAVKWAAETGVTTGVGDGLFAPEWVCTRGQIVTFLWRASGSPAPKATELPFTDVAADAYYAQAVLWAVENGITNGTSETTFSPGQTCTRAHAVAFLYRMSGSPAAAGSTFSDVAADAYYRAAVAWAVEKGITNGTSGTTFSPDDTCTRGQIVTFLYRLAQTK